MSTPVTPPRSSGPSPGRNARGLCADEVTGRAPRGLADLLRSDLSKYSRVYGATEARRIKVFPVEKWCLQFDQREVGRSVEGRRTTFLLVIRELCRTGEAEIVSFTKSYLRLGVIHHPTRTAFKLNTTKTENDRMGLVRPSRIFKYGDGLWS